MQFRDMGNCTHIWELQCTLAVYTAFKTESNAIEFAKGELDNMDAGLQALRSSSGHLASVEINGIKCSQVFFFPPVWPFALGTVLTIE